jgi:LmbE family N-acetylglucosaminyl deacetylase
MIQIDSPERRIDWPGERLQIIVPHPDDESLGAGGLIQRAVQGRAACRLVIVSDGNRRKKMRIRRAEIARASAHLGLPFSDVVFLDFPDGRLERCSGLGSRLLENLRNFAPTTVVTADPMDRHSDHSHLGRLIFDLLRGAASVRRLWGSLIHFPRFPEPGGFRPELGLHPPAFPAVPNPRWVSLVLTPEEQARKRAAIAEYRSQNHFFLRRLLRSFDRTNEIFREWSP